MKRNAGDYEDMKPRKNSNTIIPLANEKERSVTRSDIGRSRSGQRHYLFGRDVEKLDCEERSAE